MKKFINGEYVNVEAAAEASIQPVRLLSKAARDLMAKHPDVDFMGLIGTGEAGLVTKCDVEKLLAVVAG